MNSENEEEVASKDLIGGGELIATIYNVKEMFESDAPEWWWEYRVIENDEKGRFFKDWDSYHETYNGVQKLTKDQAREAAVKFVEENQKI